MLSIAKIEHRLEAYRAIGVEHMKRVALEADMKMVVA